MADIFQRINREWTDREPIFGSTQLYNYQYIQPANPYLYDHVYTYVGGNEDLDLALIDHVTGNPRPAVAQVVGLPDWAEIDGTHIKGTAPDDFDEQVEVKVVFQN